MALSDHEQHLLQQLERSLAIEDPSFADRLRNADVPGVHRFRMVIYLVEALIGLAGLVAGVAFKSPAIGALGFVLMLVGVVYVIKERSLRRVGR